MAPHSAPRRLIVNADDFGRSPSINRAVIRAHQEGILTTASLMVNEASLEEAVGLARQNPRLGVGLHLTLLCGHSALCFDRIPGLVNEKREFSDNPTAVGFKYFWNRRLRQQLEAEISAQFEKFRATGLTLDHVNGHLHMHLHPVVLDILLEHAAAWGIKHVRCTREPFWLNARIASGRWLYRSTHALIYRLLSARALPLFRNSRIRHTSAVFGLLQNERVDEDYLLRLLPALPLDDVEIYSHPSMDEYKNEFEALISPAVMSLVKRLNLSLVRYQDL
ncbi:MAG: Hopanoid biosynthesis associated protein HpnK [Verrucomicrobiales bacterium]|nr:Hopanoid biosynthesis associated protein HpnK [Verrucomicrobiales bacterium]